MKRMTAARHSLRGALLFALGGLLGALNCGRTEYECHLPGESPTYELKCGGTDNCLMEVTLPVEPPSVLIALDRSCSMKYLIDERTKWEIATESLQIAVAAYPELWWGGLLFPDRGQTSCEDVGIPVRPGPENGQAVIELLADPASAPSIPCDTNLRAAITSLYQDDELRDTSRRGALLLISDGQLGCGGSGGMSASGNTLTMLREMYEESGIQTFVIGFGEEVDTEVLEEMALAGGAPADGSTPYYKAEAGDLVERVFVDVSPEASPSVAVKLPS